MSSVPTWRIVTRENWHGIVEHIAELEHPGTGLAGRRGIKREAIMSGLVDAALRDGASAMLEQLQERLELAAKRHTAAPERAAGGSAAGTGAPASRRPLEEAYYSATAILELIECAEEAPNRPREGTVGQACVQVRENLTVMMSEHEAAIEGRAG